MKPLHGNAGGGEGFDPQDLPEEEFDKSEKPREAPAPGVPISDEEFERMKEAARHAPAPRDKHAQDEHPQNEKKDD
jgi:hypothetical protein